MSVLKTNRIRIESGGPTASDARVFYVPKNGDEVEISNCIQGVDLRLRVGEATTATLHTIIVGGEARSEVERVVVKMAFPGRLDLLRWKLRRWWHKQ